MDAISRSPMVVETTSNPPRYTPKNLSIADRNMMTAEVINKYVNEKIPFILNNLSRIPEEGVKELQEKGIDLYSLQRMFLDVFEMAFGEIDRTDLSESNLLKIAEIAKKCCFGTCLEMVAVGTKFAHEKNVKVEPFCISGGNHTFLVLGRDPKSDPSNFDKWGSSAAVCDPWSGENFPAHEIPKKLENYLVATWGDNYEKPITKTEPFDAEKHTLMFLKDFHQTV